MKKLLLPAIAILAAGLTLGSCNKKSGSDPDNDYKNNDKVENTEAPANQPAQQADLTAEAPAWMPDSATITPSGLGIVIDNPGNEQHAGPSSQVTLHYRGTLTNGSVFDSSYDRGMPATFSPAQVIPGFAEGIQMIGKGGKATLYIPGPLAYGPQGVPQIGIGPNEPLIFQIEIIDIN